jgi:hypothetical protein
MVLSKAIEYLKGAPLKPSREEFELDYGTIEPFERYGYCELIALHIKFPKERRVSTENMKSVLIMLTYSAYTLLYEIIGTHKEIIIQFVCREPDVSIVGTYITSFFPKCMVLQQDKFNECIYRDDFSILVTDFGLREEFGGHSQPLKALALIHSPFLLVHWNS